MIRKWRKYLESIELVEFPLKKYTSIIRDKILNNLNIGDNRIIIDFKKDEFSESIKIILNIKWMKNFNNKINGETDILTALQNDFKEFIVNIFVENENVDYDSLLSIIQHELKHVHDVLYDESEENTFLKIKPINILKQEFKIFEDFYGFIFLVYESLKHELEARNTSIYNKFRWLKIYDKSLIYEEFKKTYTYKSLIRLQKFNADEFIKKFNLKDLKKITNRFIDLYGDFNIIIEDKDIIEFYKYWEMEFKEKSKNYLEKSDEIIDEIIKGVKPYMEGVLTTEHIDFLYMDKYEKLFNFKLKMFKK